MLRKADLSAVAMVVGVDVPARLRTVADVRVLHRPWCVAVATGLLQVGDGWVSGGPALGNWPQRDADMLAAWLTGLQAVCAAESRPQDEDSVRLLAMALLAMLGKKGMPQADRLWELMRAALDDVCDRHDKEPWESSRAAERYGGPESSTPLASLIALLAEFGAVTGHSGKPVITRWAAGHLADDLPSPADPSLPASEMIARAARFGDEQQRNHVGTQMAGRT